MNEPTATSFLIILLMISLALAFAGGIILFRWFKKPPAINIPPVMQPAGAGIAPASANQNSITVSSKVRFWKGISIWRVLTLLIVVVIGIMLFRNIGTLKVGLDGTEMFFLLAILVTLAVVFYGGHRVYQTGFGLASTWVFYVFISFLMLGGFAYFVLGKDSFTTALARAQKFAQEQVAGMTMPGSYTTAPDGLLIMRGGNIVFSQLEKTESFYVEGTVTLINGVDYSCLNIKDMEKFFVKSPEDGRLNTITPKSGKMELAIVKAHRKCA